MSFTRKDNMKRHALQAHKTIFRDNQSKDKRTPCHYQNCGQVFFQKVKLIKHIEEYYEGIFTKESYNFLSESEFLAWKEKEELNTYVFLNVKTSNYICQNDGHSKPHRSVNEPARKTNKRYYRGSVKSGAFCPARMIVKVNINVVTNVQYIKTHNHSIGITNTMYQPIPVEDFNSILVYKPQGQQTVIGPKVYDDIDLNKDSFVVGIQTKHQLSMFETHSSQIVFIDATHCTNQYAFPFVTLLVRDEFKRGYSVAFLIFNHADEQTITPFLEEIKKRCNNSVKVNAVMTDDDLSGWNAFTNVFGDVRHLLCKWHVKRAWRNKLPLVGPTNLQEEVYRILETIIDEKKPDVFLSTMNGFVKTYEHICPNFISYFVTYYAPRHLKWASCYRNFQHADTDTNMLCKSFHNKLKTVYMERRPNKRHEKGMLISDKCISKCSLTQYTVKSQSKDVTYNVDILTEACKESLCLESCINSTCNGLCEHLYRCSCNDIVILCKHVHKLQSFLLRSRKKNCPKDSLAVDTGNNQMKQKSQTFINESERFHKNINELSTLVSRPMIINLQFSSINRQLEDMIKQAEAIKNINLIEIPIEPTLHNNLLNFEPNKKLDINGSLINLREQEKEIGKRK
ncbi:uncharacterized protein LOC136092817 [Hydra vulgaris]|uniref:uncharacterized protein LOC136092817 n=1 Tax=Hydra vulgaris TaxID=6087 RepID=UPI0032EA066C